MGPLQPRNTNQGPPAQKVDLMVNSVSSVCGSGTRAHRQRDLQKTVYPEEDYYRKSLTLVGRMSIVRRGGHLIVALQSIVPELDEEEEEQTMDTLSVAFPDPEGSSETLKRKSSLVELVLVSALHRVVSRN